MSNYEFVDDRTEEQKQILTWLVIGTDKSMSGWGRAKGGTSVAAWACDPKHRKKVLAWVSSRSEMKRVREASELNWSRGEYRFKRYRPKTNSCKHFHIYAVEPGHPALV